MFDTMEMSQLGNPVENYTPDYNHEYLSYLVNNMMESVQDGSTGGHCSGQWSQSFFGMATDALKKEQLLLRFLTNNGIRYGIDCAVNADMGNAVSVSSIIFYYPKIQLMRLLNTALTQLPPASPNWKPPRSNSSCQLL